MKTELAARLAQLAAQAKVISYGALAREFGWRVSVLAAALEALMEEDAALGHPFRAALLEARLTPGCPAPGFFAKAAELGRNLAPEDVAAERAALFAAASGATSAP